MSHVLKGHSILVTGGTGSFGGTFVRALLERDVGEIVVFSRDEKKQEDMRNTLSDARLRYIVGDVRDRDRVADSLRGVDFVFHAAALKQVPSCEHNPYEAVMTNVLGTENILSGAVRAGVKKLILLSTDKAVHPVNAMGMSKALGEKLLVAKSREARVRGGPVLCATRYGNVLASRGSVVPLFVSCIKNNKPLPITDPDMTRFIMSLEESVSLVLHAFAHGNFGDIFVQKSNACTVSNLATALLEIFRSKAPLMLTGPRVGEKRYETLVTAEEMSKSEDMGRYFRIGAESRELKSSSRSMHYSDEYNSNNAGLLSVEELTAVLLSNPFISQQVAEITRS